MKKTILIGGKFHGQPITLPEPALATLVMVDEPISHVYTLAHFENTEHGSEEEESRSFYISDDTEPSISKQLVLEHWAAGAILRK